MKVEYVLFVIKKMQIKQKYIAKELKISEAKFTLYLQNKANLKQEEQSKLESIITKYATLLESQGEIYGLNE
jgi:predicted transcriptional regulator